MRWQGVPIVTVGKRLRYLPFARRVLAKFDKPSDKANNESVPHFPFLLMRRLGFVAEQ